MPLSGPHTYIETITEFEGYWPVANTAHGSAITPNGYALADLTTDKAELQAAINDIVSDLNDIAAMRTLRDMEEIPIRNLIFQLKAGLKGLAAATGYQGSPIQVPDVKEDMGNWQLKMRHAVDAWTKANAILAPDLILGTTTLAQFIVLVNAMNVRLEAIESRQYGLTEKYRRRDFLMEGIVDHLQDLIQAIMAHFPPDDPVVLGIPRLFPLPGHTPDPVVLSGEYNTVSDKVALSWTPSEDADLASYKVYGGLLSGLGGDGVEASNYIATIPAGTTSYESTYGMGTSGQGARFKVYVVLDTGNQAGSNTVDIIVPPGEPGGGPPPPP